MPRMAVWLLVFVLVPIAANPAQAQFVDSFEEGDIQGWEAYTGDGNATVEVSPRNGHARIRVDATEDRHNVWWAIIKRNVASALPLSKLEAPDHELRVEARVRVSDAPRRLNFMINTQRTTNYHKHLREYDIPDTTGWHTISMTTEDLDARPGDTLNVQLGITDWGRGRYHVDVDYYRVDIVDVNEVGPDKGEPLPYHPPIPDTDTFSQHRVATHDAVINADFPQVNFHDWHDGKDTPVLTVSANQWPVLRWDFGAYAQAEAEGAAILELSTHSVLHGGAYADAYEEGLGVEFGKVRVVEILGGDPDWDEATVTYNRLTQGAPADDVFNEQMIFDAEVSEGPGSSTYVTIPRPVVQRLLDGTTHGLVLKPLGAIDASFFAAEHEDETLRPTLHVTVNQ